MRMTSRILILILAVLLVMSAGNLTFAADSNSKTVTIASAQVAAAAYVQQWGQTLWNLVTNQTGTQLPSFGDPVFNPDGSISQSYTAVDGTVAVLTSYIDGTMRIDFTLPSGITQVAIQSVPVFDGISKFSIDWTVTSSTGMSVEYTSIVDDKGTWWDISDDTTELTGSSVLPDGITQTFYVLTEGGYTDIESVQSDGSTFTLHVPLRFPDYTLPEFSQPTTGTYKIGSFNISFVLTGTAQHPFQWAAMSSDLGRGIYGAFALGDDFAGYGQLYEIVRSPRRSWFFGPRVSRNSQVSVYAGSSSQQILAILSWTQLGDSQVYFMSRETRKTGPAGAARDCLVNQWQTLTALFAPSPGF